MAKMTMIKAITAAMDEELAHDDKVMIFGEDVGKNGGVFRATDGLQEKFGEDRVFDTPLAESGIIGMANGMALEGFRPVPELQFMGFIYEAFDELAGQDSHGTDGDIAAVLGQRDVERNGQQAFGGLHHERR